MRWMILAVWCCQLQVLIRATEKSPRIIIVGAGASGIAAASRLLQNGFNNITILEAENRIGGRIYTKEFGGYNIDVGGQWVHGVKGNVAYELAWPLDLLEHSPPHGRSKIFSSSEPRITEETGNELLQEYEKMLDTMIPEEYANKSAGDYLKLKFDEFFDSHPNATIERTSTTGMFNLMVAGLNAADSWYNVSTRGDYVACEGDLEVNWKDRGYSTILDILMKKIPNPDEEIPVMNNTILNAEVRKISYDGPDESAAGVRVVTASGDEYSADHAIVTVSIGVLKSDHETMFDPRLPEVKRKAIQGLQLGNVVKLILLYDEPWWDEENAMYLHWTDKDRNELANDPEKSWMLGLSEMGGIAHKPRILLCWVNGAHSREMETLPEDRVFTQVKQVIRRFFENTHNLTEPTAMLRSQWYSNKHFRGTWSYQTPEFHNSGSKSTDLSDPIEKNGKPVVQFAGEVTSRTKYSTVHGAIASGWREADRLIHLYSHGQEVVE